MSDRSSKRILAIGLAVAAISVVLAAACILFVVLGGLRTLVAASGGPSWERRLIGPPATDVHESRAGEEDGASW